MTENTILKVFDRVQDNFISHLLDYTTDGCALLDVDKKIVYWNKTAEDLTGFTKEEMMGKSCQSENPLYTDYSGQNICASSCVCDKALKEKKPQVTEIFIQNKAGYRLPARLKVLPVINADGQATGIVEIFTSSSPAITIPLRVPELERMQLLDIDTGLPNRFYMEMYLKNRIAEFHKYNLSFGVIYADVDNYNKVQERFGRFNGAKLIRMIARTLQKNIRYLDLVARWDNEEFIVCLLNIDENRLDIVANKLRLLVAESYITVETGLLNATISMGASLVQRFDTVESLIKRAEQLMLHSKWLGRNRVSLTFTQKET
ncbi:MAG: diguanylate cyclase domain-containing protein [Candidatus Saccharicenans sp.]|uniref:diguanylate cyclase domain-containing protein n=1 Tax=Candidatus Saccharicenans sp. TaxID=2819258 RepID=UPI00404B8FB9